MNYGAGDSTREASKELQSSSQKVNIQRLDHIGLRWFKGKQVLQVRYCDKDLGDCILDKDWVNHEIKVRLDVSFEEIDASEYLQTHLL